MCVQRKLHLESVQMEIASVAFRLRHPMGKYLGVCNVGVPVWLIFIMPIHGVLCPGQSLMSAL